MLKPGGLFAVQHLRPRYAAGVARAPGRRVDGYNHVNHFIDMHDIGDALVRAGLDRTGARRRTHDAHLPGRALADARPQGHRRAQRHRRPRSRTHRPRQRLAARDARIRNVRVATAHRPRLTKWSTAPLGRCGPRAASRVSAAKCHLAQRDSRAEANEARRDCCARAASSSPAPTPGRQDGCRRGAGARARGRRASGRRDEAGGGRRRQHARRAAQRRRARVVGRERMCGPATKRQSVLPAAAGVAASRGSNEPASASDIARDRSGLRPARGAVGCRRRRGRRRLARADRRDRNHGRPRRRARLCPSSWSWACGSAASTTRC